MPASAHANRAQADAQARRALSLNTHLTMQPRRRPASPRPRAASLRARNSDARPSFHID